jgi:hypothetical protein
MKSNKSQKVEISRLCVEASSMGFWGNLVLHASFLVRVRCLTCALVHIQATANSRTELQRSHDISWNLEAQLDVLKAYTFIIEVLLHEPLPIPSINLFQHHSSPSHSAIKAHIPAISITQMTLSNRSPLQHYIRLDRRGLLEPVHYSMANLETHISMGSPTVETLD